MIQSKKWALFGALLIIAPLHKISAQSSYQDYSTSDKTFEYREDFSNSSVFWESYEAGRRSVEIENGALIFASLNDKTQVKYKTVDVDWDADWELEIGVRWVQGKTTTAIDFIWDKETGNSNKYHFGFTAGGKYVLAEYKDNSYQHIANFIPASFVNKTTRNRLTVRKVGRTYYLFVNERLVKTMAYKPVKGDVIGFTVPPNTTISIDYLYAFSLNKSTTSTSASNTSSSNSGTVSSGNTSYNAYSSSDKTSVYREDFDNNSSKWEVYRSGERMGKIQNGFFDWISMNDKAQMISHNLSYMDWNRDWQIEIRMKHLTGKPNSSNDLLWNISEGVPDKYHFGFTAQGKYVFSKKVGSEYQPIVPFTSSSVVNKSGFNKITVRKVGSTYYYFFNERLITTKYGHTVTSNKIGFMVPPSSTLQVDYLDVSYLKPVASTTTSNSSSLSGQQYLAVMTKYNGYSLQRWKTRDKFPKDEIKADWDDDYYVSDLSYDNSKWTLVMSKGTGFSTQRWKTRFEFPKADIKELWDDGYSITELNYGNGVWALVMSKSSKYGRQRWATSSTFPKEKIQEFWDDGLDITEITYGKDRWAVVGTNTSMIGSQKWFTRTQFPNKEIQEYWDLGYSITQLSHHQGLWVLLMSKYTDGRKQRWFRTDDFPKDKIRQYWDDGYYITDISHGKR